MTIKLTAAASVIVSFLVITVVAAATITTTHAQILPITIPDIDEQTHIFQSVPDGIRFRLPQGWVVSDYDNTLSANRQAVGILGFSILAAACPQSEAQPAIGGLYNCDPAETKVYVSKDLALNDKEEFAIYAERNVSEITIDDYVVFNTMQRFKSSLGVVPNNVEIVSSVDKPVNVVFTDTNRTVTTPGKFVEVVISGDDNVLSPDIRSFRLLTIINEGRTTIHGYDVSYEGPVALTPSGRVPNAVQEIFDTFEILAPSPTS
ncbi:MAG TPA: hypothetical protein VE544_09490 [Nitrososphaeraceae archaeon]|nr:hypothetical protein [Nitrososphaeraceae archaeon]